MSAEVYALACALHDRAGRAIDDRALGVLDRAEPRLSGAHHQLWPVRENCRDAVMYDALTEAMLETQRALGRLARISQEARDA